MLACASALWGFGGHDKGGFRQSAIMTHNEHPVRARQAGLHLLVSGITLEDCQAPILTAK